MALRAAHCLPKRPDDGGSFQSKNSEAECLRPAPGLTWSPATGWGRQPLCPLLQVPWELGCSHSLAGLEFAPPWDSPTAQPSSLARLPGHGVGPSSGPLPALGLPQIAPPFRAFALLPCIGK